MKKPAKLKVSNRAAISREAALFQITECAVTCHTIEEYAEKLHVIVKQLTYAENFFIALYEQDKSQFNFVYVVDEFEDVGTQSLNKMPSGKLRRTLTGYMLRTGQTQHLSSEEIEFLTKKNVVDSVGSDCHDWLGIPLKYNEEILGALVIQSYREDITYNKQEEKILEFVARQIALVIKSKQSEIELRDANTILERRVNERTREIYAANEALKIEVSERRRSQQIQTALFQITELVNTAESLQDLFYRVHQIIKQLMYAENEYVALLDKGEKTISFPYFVDEAEEQAEDREVNEPGAAGFTEKVIQSGESFLFHRGKSIREPEGAKKCTSWLGVPLRDKYKVFGVLVVQSYQDNIIYTREDEQVLITIGQQVATAILRKKDADSLAEAHEHLEQRVRARTAELEKTIEKRRIVEQRLAHESLHDSLTGLPNRAHLSRAVSQLMDNIQTDQTKCHALLFLDLDRFKIINDSLGHHIGDLFLVEVAKRLQSCVRSDDLVARLGGDEFCVLMPSIIDNTIALKLSNRLLTELKKPFEVQGHSLITSASIGVRLTHSQDDSAERVMSDADAAMYQAKHQGKNRYCFFDASIKELVTNRMKMERDLRGAVSGGQLFLVYQPIYNILTRVPEGFEALIRWNHPESGLISPEQFIPVAEETGIIVEIGEMVITQACQMLAEFKKQAEFSNLYINVNVSSVQILSRTLDDFVRQHLTQYGLSPDKLNIEITESILIEDYKAALNFVREVRAMGCKVYLDDFGTGYSSLSYLHKFPFDAIKLDRSFINALDGNLNNEAIVESVADLANNLNIAIIAEGIETEQQLEKIAAMGYTIAQGYLLSKPLNNSDLFKFMGKQFLNG